MEANRYVTMSQGRMIRNYLWRNDKKEWFITVLNIFFVKTKSLTSLALFLILILILSSTVADGTVERQFLAKQVRYLMDTLPLMEEAYREIDRMGSSISKATAKDLDLSFIYAFLITKWARHYNLDPLEVAAVAMTESRFNHQAVSRKDARGLMQVHRPTWPMEDYFDTEENIGKGARILFMYKRGGGDYLSKYSGGAKNYAAKVKRNEFILRDLSGK